MDGGGRGGGEEKKKKKKKQEEEEEKKKKKNLYRTTQNMHTLSRVSAFFKRQTDDKLW